MDHSNDICVLYNGSYRFFDDLWEGDMDWVTRIISPEDPEYWDLFFDVEERKIDKL